MSRLKVKTKVRQLCVRGGGGRVRDLLYADDTGFVSHSEVDASGIICQQYGFDYHILMGVCPAEGDLQFLPKSNHFEKVCTKKIQESKRVRQVQPEIRKQQLIGDSSEHEYVRVVDSRSTKGQNKGSCSL